jgi:NAD(P)-dependent dehydrogenase (short-subunit alcohol dehydrogenase family)
VRPRHSMMPQDVTRREDLVQARDRVTEILARTQASATPRSLAVLIANAGIAVAGGFETLPSATIRQMYDVNVYVLRCTRTLSHSVHASGLCSCSNHPETQVLPPSHNGPPHPPLPRCPPSQRRPLQSQPPSRQGSGSSTRCGPSFPCCGPTGLAPALSSQGPWRGG